jgi:hypothetical protein
VISKRTDNLRRFEFPRRASHSVDRIRATDANSKEPKTASVRCMRVYTQSEVRW